MVPWPIALLVLWYAGLATASAATLWKLWHGQVHGAILWLSVWCGVSAVLVVGLAWLKPWARKLAIWSSGLILVGALANAGLAIAQAAPQPMRSVLATGIASIQLVVIRYLTRPHVKAWFKSSGRLSVFGDR